MEDTVEKTQTNELVKIIEASGLEKTKAQTLQDKFSNYFEIAAEWERKTKALVITDISQKAEMKMADEARKFLKDKRVDIEKARVLLKEDSLREGKAIDAIAKALKNLIEPIEKELEQKAKFKEIFEAKVKAELKSSRETELKQFDAEVEFVDLANMPEESYVKFLASAKIAQAQRIEAERIAEEERLAKEKEEAEEKAKMKAENERLKKEAEEREEAEAKLREVRSKRDAELRPYIVFIRDYSGLVEKEEADYQKEFSEIKKGAELQWEHDRKEQIRKANEEAAAEAKAQKEKAKQEAILKKEREAKAQLEAELKAKKEAEEKAILDEQLKAEAELSKGDAEKFVSIMESLEMLKYKYTFKSKKYKALQNRVNILIDKIIVDSKEKV